MGPQRFAAVARTILPADPDYGRLWRIVNANNSNRYDAYQAKTDRAIPVIRLTPT